VVATGAVDLSGVARAADVAMPVKAAPIVARTWDGCYAGGQLGATQGSSTWSYRGGANLFNSLPGSDAIVSPTEEFREVKATVGGQVGCNFSYGGPWLLGLEGSALATPMDRARSNGIRLFSGTELIRTEIRSIVSTTARIGFTPTPDWLVYVKGGYAAAYIDASGSIPDNDDLGFGISRWHHGWTVGSGFEYRLFRNVSVGAEYSYYNFGDRDYTQVNPLFPAGPIQFRAGAEVHSAMARINFYDPNSPAARTNAAFSSPAFAGRFSSFVDAGTQYGAWQGTRGPNTNQAGEGKGYQVYSPVAIGIDYDEPNFKVETRARGGYVYSANRTDRLTTRDTNTSFYSGPVDTQTSFNVVMLNFENIRPQVGVAMNLPTGTSYLPDAQRLTRFDPDLAPVGSYGAGFNINPTAGFVVGLDQNTAVSLSAGYAWQGKFVREALDLNTGGQGSFAVKRYINPGDVVTANFNITTQVGNTAILGSFAYMSETEVTIDGVKSGKSGGRYNSNLTLSTQIDDRWSVNTNMSWSFAEKNEIVVVGGGTGHEPKNSNSHVVIGSVEPGYMVTERLRVAANYSFLWRDENFYDPVEAQFIPAKTKHSAGLVTRYAFTDTASIEVRGAHSWITQDASAILPLLAGGVGADPPQLHYTAWTVATSGNFRF
jgi:outer membrane immunogenic protein